jgi:hypothetical protein
MMVIAIAGRRIDAPDNDTPCFPLRNVALVEQRISTLFELRKPTFLVSSAACGADLIALEQAHALGINCRVILPFDPDRFRRTSVVDRPGDWGMLYDRLIGKIASSGNLIISSTSGGEASPYEVVNRMILDEAEALAKSGKQRAIAVLVWDGRPRDRDDYTKSFGDAARQRGLDVLNIPTVD